MYTDILKETKIIVIILRAAPVVTVARTIIITAWDIFRSIAMVMAVPILTNISMKTTMIAAVAMTMVPKSIIIMSMKNMMTMNAAVDTSIITTSTRMMSVAVDTSMSTMSTRMMNAAVVMSMKSMSTMSVAVVTSITIMSIMCPVIPMTADASFAIPTKSTAMFAAKA